MALLYTALFGSVHSSQNYTWTLLGRQSKLRNPTEKKTRMDTVLRGERFHDDEEFLARVVVAVEGILL